MLLSPGYKSRNITFVKYASRLCESAIWECPFCHKHFKEKVENVLYNSTLFSCGCVSSEEALNIYYDRFKNAYPACNSLILRSCQRAGITYGMFKSFLKDDKFKSIIEELDEAKRDRFEEAFLQKVDEGNIRAIEIAMKSKFMASRGYCPQTAENDQITLDLGEKIINDL